MNETTVMQPLPAGAYPLPQHLVTPDITDWALALLHDETEHPMGSVDGPRVLGGLELVARVEVHTWFGADDTRPSHPHRGVSVYVVPQPEAA
jgi:hypothetical protein